MPKWSIPILIVIVCGMVSIGAIAVTNATTLRERGVAQNTQLQDIKDRLIRIENNQYKLGARNETATDTKTADSGNFIGPGHLADIDRMLWEDSKISTGGHGSGGGDVQAGEPGSGNSHR